MFPTHNTPTGQPSPYRSEQVSSATGQQPPTPSIGEWPRPEGPSVTERHVSHPQQPAAPEAAVVTITKEQIPSEWKDQLRANWTTAADLLKLSPRILEMLYEAGLITPQLQQEAQADTSDETRSFRLLGHIRNSCAKKTWAKFLNFFNQTRAEVPSHGVLFDKFCKIHNIAGASVCSPSVQPAAVFSQPHIAAAPVVSQRQEPVATPQPEAASTVVAIRPEQIPTEWKKQLRQNLWVETGQQLRLAPSHLNKLKEARVITTPLQQQANGAPSDKQRNFLVLDHIVSCGIEGTWADFLNFLNQTRGEVASHGALFDKFCKIHNIAGASVCSPSVQPAAVFSQPHIQTAPVVSQRPEPVTVRVAPVVSQRQEPVAVRVAPVVSQTPRTQPAPEPMDFTPSVPQAAAPHHNPSTSVAYKQILAGKLRPYLQRELQAKNIRNRLLANEVISYPLYKAIKKAPSSQQANELLIAFIEQAPDAAPWHGLLKTIQLRRVQRDWGTLEEVAARISAAVATTETSVAVQEPTSSQKTAASVQIAQGSYDQQPLAPHQKILREKWVYLVSELVTKNMANELFAKGFSDDLYERINNAVQGHANELLLEYLYEADSDKPWRDFMEVLSSRRLQRDYGVLGEVYQALVRAESAHNSR